MESIDFYKNRLFESQKIQFLIVVALSILAGYLIIRVSSTFKVLIFLFPFVIFLLSKPKWGVYVLLTTIFYADWLSMKWHILPRALSWQIEMVIAILIVTAIARVTLRNAKIIRTPLDKFFIILVIISVVSHFINSSSPIITALGLRNTFKYPLFFYLLIQLDLDEKFYKNVIRYFIFLALIQILVVIIQSSIWGPEVEKALMMAGEAVGCRYDFCTGTLGLGASGGLGLLMINMISILIGLYLYLKRNIFIILAILALIPPVLAESRGSILLLPLVLLFLFKRNLFTGKFFSRLLLFGLISVIVLFLIFFISPTRQEGLRRYDLQMLYRVHIKDLSAEQTTQGKLANIILANKIISRSWKNQLLGFSLGSASPSIFADYAGPIYSEYEWASINNQQISWTMLELGYLGLFLFFVLIYRIYRTNKLFFNQVKDRYWKGMSFGFMGVIFLFAVGTLYIPVWYSDILAFCFWFFSAVVISIGRKKQILR